MKDHENVNEFLVVKIKSGENQNAAIRSRQLAAHHQA